MLYAQRDEKMQSDAHNNESSPWHRTVCVSCMTKYHKNTEVLVLFLL